MHNAFRNIACDGKNIFFYSLGSSLADATVNMYGLCVSLPEFKFFKIGYNFIHSVIIFV